MIWKICQRSVHSEDDYCLDITDVLIKYVDIFTSFPVNILLLFDRLLASFTLIDFSIGLILIYVMSNGSAK